MKARVFNLEACFGRRSGDLRGPSPRAARAFTLIELMTVVVIISVLLTLSGLAFRKVTDGNVLAQARNMVVNYAKITRAYAVANRIETMMVVNPFNGRFELWYLASETQGGQSSPLSDCSPTPCPDGYRFAPVFDSSARIPVDGNGKPVAAVHPIDFADPDLSNPPATYRPTAADPQERNIDNLVWAAFCFDENGRLVIRTRRIATRTFTLRNDTVRPDPDGANGPLGPNRLRDESPDLTLGPPPLRASMVNGGTGGDTPITSTRGFVISDVGRLKVVEPFYNSESASHPSNPSDLVNGWLKETLPNHPYSAFATTVVLNRFTGQELIGGGP